MPAAERPFEAKPEDIGPLSFGRVFEEEAAYVGRTLRYLGVSDPSLEDACQEVFVVVHRRLADFRGGSVRAWVRQVCVLVANNHRRTVRRRREVPSAEPTDTPMPASQEIEVETRQVRQRLLSALDTLPEDQRAVFVLFEIEGLSMSEVAEASDCPLQTAYARLYAARDRLRAQMKGFEP
jgi:RNA polymerase sigma-70 factor (ECF subfamily)